MSPIGFEIREALASVYCQGWFLSGVTSRSFPRVELVCFALVLS